MLHKDEKVRMHYQQGENIWVGGFFHLYKWMQLLLKRWSIQNLGFTCHFCTLIFIVSDSRRVLKIGLFTKNVLQFEF